MEGITAEILPETSSMWGAWVLDVARSDTFEDFLKCLGAPEAEAQTHAAGEHMYLSRNVIALDSIRLVIYKDTAVNQYTESFELDQEQVSEAPGGGVKRTVASLGYGGRLDGYVIATSITGPPPTRNSETVETRQLIDGGNGHIQQIDLRNLATGASCVMRRYWVRVPLAPEDQIRLLAV